MKFFSENKSEIVWDKERGKPLCQFENGEFKITDCRQIDILKNLGYRHNGPPLKELSVAAAFEDIPDEKPVEEKISEDIPFDTIPVSAVNIIPEMIIPAEKIEVKEPVKSKKGKGKK